MVKISHDIVLQKKKKKTIQCRFVGLPYAGADRTRFVFWVFVAFAVSSRRRFYIPSLLNGN